MVNSTVSVSVFRSTLSGIVNRSTEAAAVAKLETVGPAGSSGSTIGVIAEIASGGASAGAVGSDTRTIG